MTIPRDAIANSWVSIHDVAERLGVVLSNEQAWEIGAEIANRWETVMRARPTKDLRPKKVGQGSHCFAVYPPTWVPFLEGAIREAGAESARQGRLEI